MKRLLRSRLEIPGRRVSTIFLDRRRGIRSFHQNGQQKKQQQQQHTRATAAVASCATKFRFNNSAGLLQLGYRPYLGSIAAATSSGNGGHQKGTHISNSASLVCAAVAAAAAAAAAADYPSVSTEGRRFSDVYIDVENNTLGSGEFTHCLHYNTWAVSTAATASRIPVLLRVTYRLLIGHDTYRNKGESEKKLDAVFVVGDAKRGESSIRSQQRNMNSVQ